MAAPAGGQDALLSPLLNKRCRTLCPEKVSVMPGGSAAARAGRGCSGGLGVPAAALGRGNTEPGVCPRPRGDRERGRAPLFPREGIRDPRSASRPLRGLRGSGMEHPGRAASPALGWAIRARVKPAGFPDIFPSRRGQTGALTGKNPIPCGSEPKWLLQGHRGGLRQSWELNASVSRASPVLLSPGKQHKPRCEKGMKYFYSSFFFLQMKKIIMQKTFSMQNISF